MPGLQVAAPEERFDAVEDEAVGDGMFAVAVFVAVTMLVFGLGGPASLT